MATLKAIAMRLRAVTNIQKITKSMKMVSAAKYARAERELKPARAYGYGAQAFFEKAEVQAPEKPQRVLIVATTSDRGLCGSAHSNIGRAIRADVPELPAGSEFKIVCIGDKSRAILSRLYGPNMLMHFADIGRRPPTFGDASFIAQEILKLDYDFDKALMYYNIFRSVVAFKTTTLPFYTLDQVTNAGKINLYDSLDDDVTRSYNEMALANLVYYALKESACSEQSARMTAMDGASKNAGEMIDKLTLAYNRTRQAVITRELIEIISGAAAL
jgi:F-type H+-transporting ATPase subunit gamma